MVRVIILRIESLFGVFSVGENTLAYRFRHSHEFEVKSGMLVMPKPSNISSDEWEKAEVEAMKEVVGLYGKTWHFWQVDKDDELPLGKPTSISDLETHLFDIAARPPEIDGITHKCGTARYLRCAKGTKFIIECEPSR